MPYWLLCIYSYYLSVLRAANFSSTSANFIIQISSVTASNVNVCMSCNDTWLYLCTSRWRCLLAVWRRRNIFFHQIAFVWLEINNSNLHRQELPFSFFRGEFLIWYFNQPTAKLSILKNPSLTPERLQLTLSLSFSLYIMYNEFHKQTRSGILGVFCLQSIRIVIFIKGGSLSWMICLRPRTFLVYKMHHPNCSLAIRLQVPREVVHAIAVATQKCPGARECG